MSPTIKRKESRTVLRPAIRFLKFRLLHIDDSPHRLALGAALGVFIAYTPPFGQHILLAVLLAMVLRANKFVALTWIWISNPFTFMPLYYPNYLLGRVVLSCVRTEQHFGSQQVAAMLKQSLSLGHIVTECFSAEFWQQLGGLIAQIGFEMLIGGLILGTIAATIVYFGSFHLIQWYRRKRPHRRFQQYC